MLEEQQITFLKKRKERVTSADHDVLITGEQADDISEMLVAGTVAAVSDELKAKYGAVTVGKYIGNQKNPHGRYSLQERVIDRERMTVLCKKRRVKIHSILKHFLLLLLSSGRV